MNNIVLLKKIIKQHTLQNKKTTLEKVLKPTLSNECFKGSHLVCNGKKCDCTCHYEIISLSKKELIELVMEIRSHYSSRKNHNSHFICRFIREYMKMRYKEGKTCTVCSYWVSSDFPSNYCICCGKKFRIGSKRNNK